MVDSSTLTTPDNASTDEWYDALTEYCLCIDTNNSTSIEYNCNEQLHSEEILKDCRQKTTNEIDTKHLVEFNKNDSIDADLNLRSASFCYEKLAMEERENCDYTIKITLDMAKNSRAPRKIRIYSDGKEQHSDEFFIIKMFYFIRFRYLRFVSCWPCSTIDASKKFIQKCLFTCRRL